MIVTHSKSTLVCAALATALAMPGRAIAQQRTSDARVRDLVQQAAQIVASGQARPDDRPAGWSDDGARGGSEDRGDAGPKPSSWRWIESRHRRPAAKPTDQRLAHERPSDHYPSPTSTISTQEITNPVTNTITGGTIGSGTTNGTGLFNGGITQSIPKGGCSYDLTRNNQRATSTAAISRYNPAYSPVWSGQYTQPLLRGFGTDSTRQQLQVTKLNRDVTDIS